MANRTNRYVQLVEHIFHAHYKTGDKRVRFPRAELEAVADQLGIKLPKNLGDIPYTFRYRAVLPKSILALAPEGLTWVIRSVGRSLYEFTLVKELRIEPNGALAETKVPDATPGIVTMYAQGDEQALLAQIRYNRLIDVFTGLTCYSLQNHLRTTVPDIGQVETDEVYIGIDKRGVHYVVPVQAKGTHERLGVVQIEQDFALCADKFEGLVCRPIGAQFIEDNLIALFEFVMTGDGVRLVEERHYRLVAPEKISTGDLEGYRNTSDNT